MTLLTKDWLSSKEILAGPKTQRMVAWITKFKEPVVIWKKDRLEITAGDKKVVMTPDGVKSEDRMIRESLKLVPIESLLKLMVLEESPIMADGEFKVHIREGISKYFFQWGNEATSLLFLCHDIFKTRVGGKKSVRGSFCQINYADYECHMMSHHLDEPEHISFVDIPPPITAETGVNKRGENVILSEYEIIMGGDIQSSIEAVMEEGMDIVVHCCCTPVVVGEDVKSVVENLNKMYSRDIVYNDVTVDGSSDKLLKAYEPSVKDRKGINLIGFPKGDVLDELSRHIRRQGIEINAVAVPDLTDEIYERCLGAELQVLFPSKVYDKVYDVIRGMGIPCIEPTAPYGVGNTDRWLRDICERLGVAFKKSAMAHKKIGMTAGLVLSEEDVERMIDPSIHYNSIPLLDVLRDMGFKLKILLFCKASRYGVLAKRLDADRIDFLNDKDRLDSWLRGVDAVFSDFRHDMRISRSGKNRISLNVFEMGYEGANRTYLRLEKMCGFKFNKRFHKFYGAQEVMDLA